MDHYYDFTRRVLLIMGIEVGEKSIYTTSMTFLRFYTPLQILATSLQSLWYFLATEGADYFRVAAICTFIFCSQSSYKTWTIAVNQEKFKNITDRLAIFYKKQTIEEKARSSEYLLRIRSICKKVFVGQMICIWCFNLLPLVTILLAVLQGKELKYNFPYGFGWPFDPFDYYFPIFIYQLYAGQILMIGQIIMDEYFTLVVSDLVAHFDRFGERLQVVISEAAKNSVVTNKIKFRLIIKKHNELLKIFEELNGLYSYALLYQILSGSIIICFLLYMLIVSQHRKLRFYLLTDFFTQIDSTPSLRYSDVNRAGQWIGAVIFALLGWRNDKRMCKYLNVS